MKANCHTCKHDLEDPHNTGGKRMCALVAGTTERGDDMYEDVTMWLDDLDLDALDMPPTDADNCPGYEAAAPMMGEPGDYSAEVRMTTTQIETFDTSGTIEIDPMTGHPIWRPVLPHNRTEPASHIEPEADISARPQTPSTFAREVLRISTDPAIRSAAEDVVRASRLPPHIETEANAFEPASVPWDGDDDGMDL